MISVLEVFSGWLCLSHANLPIRKTHAPSDYKCSNNVHINPLRMYLPDTHSDT